MTLSLDHADGPKEIHVIKSAEMEGRQLPTFSIVGGDTIPRLSVVGLPNAADYKDWLEMFLVAYAPLFTFQP